MNLSLIQMWIVLQNGLLNQVVIVGNKSNIIIRDLHYKRNNNNWLLGLEIVPSHSFSNFPTQCLYLWVSSIFSNMFLKWLREICIVLSQKMVFWVIKSQFLRYAQVSMPWIIEKWQAVGKRGCLVFYKAPQAWKRRLAHRNRMY